MPCRTVFTSAKTVRVALSLSMSLVSSRSTMPTRLPSVEKFDIVWGIYHRNSTRVLSVTYLSITASRSYCDSINFCSCGRMLLRSVSLNPPNRDVRSARLPSLPSSVVIVWMYLVSWSANPLKLFVLAYKKDQHRRQLNRGIGIEVESLVLRC